MHRDTTISPSLLINPRSVALVMSPPSANSYLPLDSDAPALFKAVLMSNYARVAFIILMLYDHIITLDKEVLWMRTYYTVWLYVFLPGCFIEITGNPTFQRGVWIPSLSLEGALTLLTTYKVISYRNEMNRTIAVLARDSLVYFVVAFVGLALTLANSIHAIAPTVFPVLPITQCIVSMAAGRMMMNLRGLMLDDPEHTLHLHTLQFANYHDSGLWIEEPT
ncbi:hypothetical protein PILCRDRAFT_6920 [Piloderma croceum F 1598]|uniref:Uncharacterized protein n=1 Tax=Piloderma croceum (strain F 1598) TaxID=765440 RepID=A0A0C3BB10_PILCF|nr:hypothetical protein PILCRDRAFT_6920 [Piloderma croceum F 1598]